MHALSCTLKRKDESVMGYGHICFGSLDQVMNDDELGCLNEAKTRGSWRFEARSSGRACMAWSSQSEAPNQ